jgi:prepilin-type N-terminal cleavage/methylation domain-containing protein
MEFKVKTPRRTAVSAGRRAGFTLAEMLVALGLIAIITPVVVQGLKLASLAGEVSQRKALAMRVAERVLNETIVTGRWTSAGQGGTEQAGSIPLRYTIRNEPWTALSGVTSVNTANGVNQGFVNANNLHLLSVDVSFPAQGQTYSVHLSTVVDITKQITANAPPVQ